MVFTFIILAIPVCNLLWWWWADAHLRRASLAGVWRVPVAALVLAMLAVYAGLILSRFGSLGALTSRPVLTLAYVWHMVVLPLTLVVVGVSGLVKGLIWAVDRLHRSPGPPPQCVPVPDATCPTPPVATALSRRQALAAAAVWAAPTVTVLAAGRAISQLDAFRLRRIDVPIPDLPPDLDGLTIAQVADVHVGRFTRGKVLAKVAEATNLLHADLVLLPGDLIDHALVDLPEALAMVSRIDPRRGLFLCEGNHDLFESRARFDQGVLNAGHTLLLNDAATVHVRGMDVQILGTRWGSTAGGRGAAIEQNMDELESKRRPGRFQILMAHHPHSFDLAAARGIPLTLSGHTHGGQLMLTDRLGAGPMIFRYWSGLYQKGRSSLVVSNGVGNWFPLRTGAPAEIVLVTLRPGERLA